MARNQTGYIAGGTIRPARFVKLDTAADRSVLEADANEQVFGVSQVATRDTPGLSGAGTDAASAGESVQLFLAGDECLVEAGGTITNGINLKSDADGKAVAAATTGATMQWIAGQALEDGVSGEMVLIRIFPMPHYPALA